MGNSNKHKKEKNSKENLNNSVILTSHNDIIEYTDSNEKLMKSQVLNEKYNFFEHLILNEDIIESNLNLSEYNFLGEYKDNFKIIKLIQKNLISKTYKAKNIKDNKNVSLKVYNKKNLEHGDYDFFLDQIKREEEIIKLCKSDNIVNFYRKMETSDDIIYEMDSWDTNLSDYIKKNGGFLNNLKNFKKILFGIIKLGGFENAIFIKNNISESVGSYYYSAPEIIKNLEYDEKCDLWSLGITLYELLFNQLPYGKNATINMVKQSVYYDDNIILNKTNENQIDDLLEKLLTINHKNRISHLEFFNYINNCFIFEDKEDIKDKDELKDKEDRKDKDEIKYLKVIKNDLKDIKINLVKRSVVPLLELDLNNENDELSSERKNLIDNNLKENKFMNKIMDILEGGYITDIMAFPNGYIDLSKKFNNIIYYDENLKFINSINKDSDFFEKNTTGAFILCNNLESLSIIREEILKQIKKDKRTTFNLITTGSTCKKIMNYLNENKEFFDCIKNVCIYCMNINKYNSLKKQYPKIHDDIYSKTKDVLNFINKCSDINIKPYPITKVITFQEYKDKYKNRHLKISKFYGNMNKEIYKNYFERIKYLINEEEQKNELKNKKKNELLKGIKSFNLDNIENNDEDIELLNKLIIKEYTKNTIYGDLNKWLMNSNKNFYLAIAYFTARLMFSLNSYAEKNFKFYTRNKAKLYRGIKIPYSCLLPYIRAKGKIIVLTSFTSTSESKKKALSFSGRNNSIELYKTNLLFSVLFIIKNIWKYPWISSGINIQKESVYNEKEIFSTIFLFFCF